MTGWLSSFTTQIRNVDSTPESMHCVVHREMRQSPELNKVWQKVVKIINRIKAHALNSCLFMQLCEEMDAEYTRLLFIQRSEMAFKDKSLARV